MQRSLRRTARVALVSVLLVVLAGSVVRMTGSGMGCPDWPKCFGYYIPPTDEATVTWQSGREYLKGQMIVQGEKLYEATEDFVSGDEFESSHWEVYEKHDYAIFNVSHTWTEYINRLIGAFSGLPVLLLVILSVLSFKKDPLLLVLSLGVLFMLGFEAWLGKVVVDSNLAAYKISLHMGGALLIVALLILLLRRAGSGGEKAKVSTTFRWLLFGAVLLGLFQIGLGTQVRENIDVIAHSGLERISWIDQLGTTFIVHRSFAQVVVIVTVLLVWLNFKRGIRMTTVNLLGIFVLIEIIGGIVLSYLGMPAIAQPIHLLGAFLMFSFSFYALLRTFNMQAKSPQQPMN